VVEYIVEKYGFKSLKALIYQYRTPKRVEDIFMSVFDLSLASFEEGFDSWLEDRIRRIDVYVYQEKITEQRAPLENRAAVPLAPS